MAEEQVETVVQVAAPKTARKITSYSKTGKLVMDAIVNLNERKGSSIMKIRNYISAKNPEIDMNRYGGIVKKFILSALEKGELKSDDETKKSRGFFKIVDKKLIDQLKKVKKQQENESRDDEATTSKNKPSINAPSPKVKKPVKKTIKLPSAVTATTTKKKSKPKAKSSPTDSDKEPSSKAKKKTAGTKRAQKNEDEVLVPKKIAKKDEEVVEKPKAKPKKIKNAKPKEALENVQSEDGEPVEKALKGKKMTVKDVEPEGTVETVEKVPKGKKNAVKEADLPEETETVEKSKDKKKAKAADKQEKAPVKKKKAVKGANDENKE